MYYSSSSSIRVHRPSPTTDASVQGRPTAMAGGVVLCSGCVTAAPNWERSCAIVTHGTTADLIARHRPSLPHKLANRDLRANLRMVVPSASAIFRFAVSALRLFLSVSCLRIAVLANAAFPVSVLPF